MVWCVCVNLVIQQNMGTRGRERERVVVACPWHAVTHAAAFHVHSDMPKIRKKQKRMNRGEWCGSEEV